MSSSALQAVGKSPAAVVDRSMTNLKRDTLYQVGGATLCSATMLLMNLVAARALGRTGYGNFGSLQTFGVWCAMLFSFGGPMTLTLLAGRAKQAHQGGAVGMVYLYLLLVVAGTTLAVMLDFSTGLFGFVESAAPATLAMIVIYAALVAFFELITCFLRGADRFGMASLAHVGQSFALASGTIVGAYFWKDHIVALWGGNVIAVILVAAITVFIVRRWGATLSSLGQAWQLATTAGVRSYVVNGMEIGAETFGILYLTRCEDYAGVAAIVACQRICTILSKPAAMISLVLFGKVAGGASGPSAAKVTLQVARATFFMALIACLMVLPFIQSFTQLALGAEFADAAPVMALFLAGAVFRGHASAAVGFILGRGCPRSYVILKLFVLLVSIVGTIALYPSFGPLGVAFVYLVTSIVLMVGIASSVAIRAESVAGVFVGSEWQRIRQMFS